MILDILILRSCNFLTFSIFLIDDPDTLKINGKVCNDDDGSTAVVLKGNNQIIFSILALLRQ